MLPCPDGGAARRVGYRSVTGYRRKQEACALLLSGAGVSSWREIGDSSLQDGAPNGTYIDLAASFCWPTALGGTENRAPETVAVQQGVAVKEAMQISERFIKLNPLPRWVARLFWSRSALTRLGSRFGCASPTNGSLDQFLWT